MPTPPISYDDSFTLTADAAALKETLPLPDGSGTYELDGTVLDVLANDTYLGATDPAGLFLLDFTQPVAADGSSINATIDLALAPDGVHQALIFYSADPQLQVGTHTFTFTYRAADQWFTASQPSTVTVTITGNPNPGETIVGLNHPNVFTPTTIDPQIHFGLRGNDNITGGNNKDTINGGAGADTIHGNNGADLLLGGVGTDKVFGDNGSDTINGGPGDDTLSGGDGPDRFVFDYGFGHDKITDFDPHTDKIYVDHNMWGSYADLIAHGVDGPGETVTFTSDFDGYTLTLCDVELEDLKPSDFIFT